MVGFITCYLDLEKGWRAYNIYWLLLATTGLAWLTAFDPQARTPTPLRTLTSTIHVRTYTNRAFCKFTKTSYSRSREVLDLHARAQSLILSFFLSFLLYHIVAIQGSIYFCGGVNCRSELIHSLKVISPPPPQLFVSLQRTSQFPAISVLYLLEYRFVTWTHTPFQDIPLSHIADRPCDLIVAIPYRGIVASSAT